MNIDPLNVTIFNPTSDIWVHQRLIQSLIQTWSKMHHLTVVGCDASRNSVCVAQRSVGLSEFANPSERASVCKRCQSARLHNRGTTSVSLAEYQVTLPPLPTELNDIINFKIDTFPAGRASQFDFLVSHKIGEIDLAERHAHYLAKNLADAVDIYLKMKSFFRTVPSDRLVIDHELYGFNAAAKAAAEIMDIPCVSLNLGPSLSRLERSIFLVSDTNTLRLGRDQTSVLRPPDDPPKDRIGRASVSHLQTIYRDLDKKLYGSHYMIYSQAGRRSTRRNSGRRERYAAALLLSSTDEPNAYYFARAIPDRLDQIGLMKRFFLHAERHPDDLFHVRPHPRFGATHRETVEAKELSDYLEVCSLAPKNIVFGSLKSLEPLVEIFRSSDCIVGGWSSTMIDAALLGIPVIFGIPGVPEAYPSDLGRRVIDEAAETLTEAIDQAKSMNSVCQHMIALNYSCGGLESSRHGKFLPIALSPAFLVLAAHQRTPIKLPPAIHRFLRRVEISLSPGFRWLLNSSDPLLQIEPTMTREGPVPGVRAKNAEAYVSPEISFAALRSLLEGLSGSQRRLTRLTRS